LLWCGVVGVGIVNYWPPFLDWRETKP